MELREFSLKISFLAKIDWLIYLAEIYEYNIMTQRFAKFIFYHV